MKYLIVVYAAVAFYTWPSVAFLAFCFWKRQRLENKCAEEWKGLYFKAKAIAERLHQKVKSQNNEGEEWKDL